MVFNPSVSRKIVSRNFPVGNTALKFVSKFKYLGNIITDDLQHDADIEREIKSLFVRCNILISRFKYCSGQVKVKLFQTYCLCLYNPGLWHSFNKGTMHRFYSRYNKCVKRFFGFAKYSSLTSALLLTGLPSCTTVIHNFNFRFRILISTSTNVIVKSFECV